MSESQVNSVSSEKHECRFSVNDGSAESVNVSDESEKRGNDVALGTDVAQAGGSEEGLVDELNDLSQCTEESIRDEEHGQRRRIFTLLNK